MEWSLKGLANLICEKKLNAQIILYNGTAAAVVVKDYNAAQVLGEHTCWCICKHKESWKNYVENGNRIQVFFYDFLAKDRSPQSMIGCTFEKVSDNMFKLLHAFMRDDVPLIEYYGDKNNLYGSVRMDKLLSENVTYKLFSIDLRKTRNTLYTQLKEVSQ